MFIPDILKKDHRFFFGPNDEVEQAMMVPVDKIGRRTPADIDRRTVFGAKQACRVKNRMSWGSMVLVPEKRAGTVADDHVEHSGSAEIAHGNAGVDDGNGGVTAHGKAAIYTIAEHSGRWRAIAGARRKLAE